MDRYKVDNIDLNNVHDVEWADHEQICKETLPALVDLRDQGIVKHVGITNLTLSHFKYIINNVPEGTVESVLSFCHYCLNDDALSDYLDFFESKNVGVINASPFSMGLLTERGAPQWHPASKPLQDLCRKAVDHCKSQNKSIEQLAVKYSVNNPRITSTLFSTTRSEGVLQNIKWADSEFDEILYNDVRKILEPRFRDTWLNS